MSPFKIFVFLLASLQLHGQSSLHLDKPAPELDFTRVINYTQSTTSLSAFKSKVVILDFWATWCAPCIESFSHLEEMQKKFAGDLQVITITDESEERIKKFLQKRNLSLPIVIDTERTLAGKFPHRSIPHTVVIDKRGFVRAITTPAEVTPDVLKKIIDGQGVSLSEKKDVLDFDPSKPLSSDDNFTYQVMITPYQHGLPSMSNPTGGKGIYKNRRILCTNLSPKTLFEIAYQFPVGIRTMVEVKNIEAFEWSKQSAICFDLIVPEALGDQRFEIMREHLKFLYPFKPVIEKRQKKVKVLKVIEGQKLAITPTTGGEKAVEYSGRGLLMKNSELKVISEFLESQLNVPVVDETGLAGLFNLELAWFNESPKQINEELKAIGLELIDAIRDVDVLVIYDK
jgi:uncharacterized protein (TIGR03435 family)